MRDTHRPRFKLPDLPQPDFAAHQMVGDASEGKDPMHDAAVSMEEFFFLRDDQKHSYLESSLKLVHLRPSLVILLLIRILGLQVLQRDGWHCRVARCRTWRSSQGDAASLGMTAT
jgi:hypothetical protein